MNARILLILSSLVVLLTACPEKGKDPEPEPVQDPYTPVNTCGKTEFPTIDPSLMDQFLFKQGSYWIYTDSASGAIDSIYCYGPVTKKGTFKYDIPHIGPCTYHYTYANDSINPSASAYPSPYNYYLWDDHVYICHPYGTFGVHLFDNSSGQLTGQHQTQFYPTMIIQSNSYTDVYKFSFASGYWNYQCGYYYMKSGVGIIKMQLIGNGQTKVYELMRYKINK